MLIFGTAHEQSEAKTDEIDGDPENPPQNKDNDDIIPGKPATDHQIDATDEEEIVADVAGKEATEHNKPSKVEKSAPPGSHAHIIMDDLD